MLAEQVSTAPREKVIRVALAALHNLCYGRLDTLNAEMISCGLPKTLENLLDRKWSDQELKADLDYLHEALQKDARDLRCVSKAKGLTEASSSPLGPAPLTISPKPTNTHSTFERYVAEVNSGQLRWGIVHTEKFWRENVKALEANDFKTLK